MEKEYLDFDEAVTFLKTTPSTLYKWLQGGKIPGHKLGRQWRFLKDELEIHISGKGPKISAQKDFLSFADLIGSRNKKRGKDMDLKPESLAENLIWDAYDHGSRLIHISPIKGKFEIAYRTADGLSKLTSVQEDTFFSMDEQLNKISIASSHLSSRRIFLQRSEEESLQVKYQKVETATGPKVTLRIWRPELDVLSLEEIVSQKKDLEVFKAWAKKDHGLVLISGSSASGKTTTVYSFLNELKNQNRVVFSLEDSIELLVEGVHQVEIAGRSSDRLEDAFEKAYASDPDVICFGLGSSMGLEEKIFNCAYRAASTGHLVVVQMDQATCKDAVETFKKFVPYPLDHVLAGVSCQRLLEKNGKRIAEYSFLGVGKNS